MFGFRLSPAIVLALTVYSASLNSARANADFWKQIYPERPEQVNVLSMCADGRGKLYAIPDVAGNFPGLIVSTDNGQSWVTKKVAGPDGIPIFVAVDDSQYIFLNCFNGIFRSIDGGETWQHLDLGISPPELSLRSLTFARSGTIFVAGYLDRGYVFRSTNHGATWLSLDSADIAQFQFCVIADVGSNYLVAGTNDGHIVRSTNDGEKWSLTNDSTVHGAVRSFGAVSAGTLLAGSDSGFYVSQDGGASWEAAIRPPWDSLPCSISASTNNCCPLHIISDSLHTIYLNARGIVWRSVDSGAQWIKVDTSSTDFPYALNLHDLIVGPDNHLFAATDGGIFRSIRSVTYRDSFSIPYFPLHPGDSYRFVSESGGSAFDSHCVMDTVINNRRYMDIESKYAGDQRSIHDLLRTNGRDSVWRFDNWNLDSDLSTIDLLYEELSDSPLRDSCQVWIPVAGLNPHFRRSIDTSSGTYFGVPVRFKRISYSAINPNNPNDPNRRMRLYADKFGLVQFNSVSEGSGEMSPTYDLVGCVLDGERFGLPGYIRPPQCTPSNFALKTLLNPNPIIDNGLVRVDGIVPGTVVKVMLCDMLGRSQELFNSYCSSSSLFLPIDVLRYRTGSYMLSCNNLQTHDALLMVVCH